MLGCGLVVLYFIEASIWNRFKEFPTQLPRTHMGRSARIDIMHDAETMSTACLRFQHPVAGPTILHIELGVWDAL